MGNGSKKRKSTKEILPQEASPRGETFLPSNAEKIKERRIITFSFSFFDRDHELFNLGGKENDDTVGGKWFIRLFDCLKDMSSKTINELKKTPYKLHPIDYWNKANANIPKSFDQYEFWKFRLDKSHGRVIGILIDSVFYIRWLDPYHNFIDSEGYGKIQKFPKPTLN